MKATDYFLIAWYLVCMGSLAFMAWHMRQSSRRQKVDMANSERRMEEIHRLHVRAMNLSIAKLERDARDPGRPWE